MITKVQIEHWYKSYNITVFGPENYLSGHVQTFPPGYLNIQDVSYRLRGSKAQKEHLNKINAWIRSLWMGCLKCSIFESIINSWTPYAKITQPGVSNARFRIAIAFELCIQSPLFVLHMGYNIHLL